MLKNKDFKSKKLGDYNKVIITRGMEFSELGNYSLENKKNFEKLKNKLELSTGKKLQEVVAFGEGVGIVDAERDEFQKDYYNDVVIMKDSSAFAVYSEFNAPICTRIQQNDIIVSLVNNRGDKVICKLDINKIENLSKIIKNLENPNKKSEIEAIIYCHKEEIIPIKNIVMFKEKIEKLGLKEDGIIRYELDKGYVINVPKLICDILFKHKVSSDIQIIKNEEEDINNLMLFI
jgi:hypothetical protein